MSEADIGGADVLIELSERGEGPERRGPEGTGEHEGRRAGLAEGGEEENAREGEGGPRREGWLRLGCFYLLSGVWLGSLWLWTCGRCFSLSREEGMPHPSYSHALLGSAGSLLSAHALLFVGSRALSGPAGRRPGLHAGSQVAASLLVILGLWVGGVPRVPSSGHSILGAASAALVLLYSASKACSFLWDRIAPLSWGRWDAPDLVLRGRAHRLIGGALFLLLLLSCLTGIAEKQGHIEALRCPQSSLHAAASSLSFISMIGLPATLVP